MYFHFLTENLVYMFILTILQNAENLSWSAFSHKSQGDWFMYHFQCLEIPNAYLTGRWKRRKLKKVFQILATRFFKFVCILNFHWNYIWIAGCYLNSKRGSRKNNNFLGVNTNFNLLSLNFSDFWSSWDARKNAM